MPKVCIYLPERLYLEARRLDLSLSAVTQEAIERQADADAAGRWTAAQARRELRAVALDGLDTPAQAPW